MTTVNIDFNSAPFVQLKQNVHQTFKHIGQLCSTKTTKILKVLEKKKEALLSSKLAVEFFKQYSQFHKYAASQMAVAKVAFLDPAQKQITVISKQVSNSAVWRDYKYPLMIATATLVIGVFALICETMSNDADAKKSAEEKRLAVEEAAKKKELNDFRAIATAVQKKDSTANSVLSAPKVISTRLETLEELSSNETERADIAERQLLRRTCELLKTFALVSGLDKERMAHFLKSGKYLQSAIEILYQFAERPDQIFKMSFTLHRLLNAICVFIEHREVTQDQSVEEAIGILAKWLKDYREKTKNLKMEEQVVLFANKSSRAQASLEATIGELGQSIEGFSSKFNTVIQENLDLDQDGWIQHMGIKFQPKGEVDSSKVFGYLDLLLELSGPKSKQPQQKEQFDSKVRRFLELNRSIPASSTTPPTSRREAQSDE